jgi:predicted Zn-dependent protease with MMP-like domain
MGKRPRLSLDEFCQAAREVIDALPAPFRGWLENVVVEVELEPWPELVEQMGDDLLGLFEGAAITEQEYGEHLPNRIWLFKRPIEAICRSRDEIKYEIRRTVLHELAHHFGYSEDDLDDFEARESPFDGNDE